MKCSNCGKEIIEKARFCAHCGYEFKERAEIEFIEESLQNSSNSNKNPKKKYRPLIVSILAISLLTVITVSIGLWFNKGTATSNNESDIDEEAYEIYIDYDEKFLSVEETYLTDDGYVESDDIEALLDEVELIIQQGVSESVIADYNREDDNIYVKFTSGIQYIFMPYQEDVLSVGNGGQILTLEPNEDDYSVRWQSLVAWIDALYNDIPFEDSLWPYANAQLIEEIFPDLYAYDYALPTPYDIIDPLLGGSGSLRNSNVTVECMKQLGEYAIIIFEGHGAYNERVHSVLVTGESFIGWKEFSKYKNELAEGSLVLTSFPTIADTGVAYSPVRYYCITSTFVEKYIGEMEQSLLFLGACSSLKDSVLAQAFLDKGTSIVLGYPDNTSMAYEMISRSVFFYNLVQNSGTTTVADAYQDTISMVGYDYILENGNILSYIAQDGIDSRYTLNGILEETITGTITGMAYIKEDDDSVSALSGVTVTVADADGNIVETAETSELSGYTFVLPAGTYTITAEADGYETVSKEVTLAENDVLNVDFEMSKSVIELTDYYDDLALYIEVTGLQLDEDASFTEEDATFTSDYMSAYFIDLSMNLFIISNTDPLFSAYGVKIGDSKEEALAKIAEHGLNLPIESYYYDNEVTIYILDEIGVSGVAYIDLVLDGTGAVESWSVCNWPEGESYHLGIMLAAVDRDVEVFEDWQMAFIDFIYNDYMEKNIDVSSLQYQWVYIDDDNIPELYINYGSVAEGSEIAYFDGSDIITQHLYSYGLSYLEGENLFLDAGGRMDSYYDTVYTIEDGNFVVVASGDYGAIDNSNVEVDESGKPIYVYYWNDVEVTESEYQKMLDDAFDQSRAIRPFANGYYSYSDVAEQIFDF